MTFLYRLTLISLLHTGTCMLKSYEVMNRCKKAQ